MTCNAIERKNAIITSATLGIEDHGILTVGLCFEYECGGQCFTGIALDQYDKAKKRRVGTAYGTEFVLRVLATVGVSEWSQIKGKHVRVEAEMSKVHAIGNIVKNVWFNPEKDMGEFITE